MKIDIAANIHRGLYGASDKANAAENQSPDWQKGYTDGTNAPEDHEPLWEQRWQDYGEQMSEEWRAWKRGFWAALFQKITSK